MSRMADPGVRAVRGAGHPRVRGGPAATVRTALHHECAPASSGRPLQARLAPSAGSRDRPRTIAPRSLRRCREFSASRSRSSPWSRSAVSRSSAPTSWTFGGSTPIRRRAAFRASSTASCASRTTSACSPASHWRRGGPSRARWPSGGSCGPGVSGQTRHLPPAAPPARSQGQDSPVRMRRAPRRPDPRPVARPGRCRAGAEIPRGPRPGCAARARRPAGRARASAPRPRCPSASSRRAARPAGRPATRTRRSRSEPSWGRRSRRRSRRRGRRRTAAGRRPPRPGSGRGTVPAALRPRTPHRLPDHSLAAPFRGATRRPHAEHVIATALARLAAAGWTCRHGRPAGPGHLPQSPQLCNPPGAPEPRRCGRRLQGRPADAPGRGGPCVPPGAKACGGPPAD